MFLDIPNFGNKQPNSRHKIASNYCIFDRIQINEGEIFMKT